MAKTYKVTVIGRLNTAARLSRTKLAGQLIDHGFYAGQDQIMIILDRQDGQTPGQLAKKLGVRPPTVTKTIGRLQSQGYVNKRESQTDARQTIIFLTDEGRAAIKEIEKSVRKTEKQALKGIDKKEQKIILKFLTRIEANLSGNNNEVIADIDTGDETQVEAEGLIEVHAMSDILEKQSPVQADRDVG